ncbi:MAG TPA: methyltransferase domain-containing protein [Thermomicrobiaceae bacterium]|nr:methyltransferase domain-containing protein [Thermomicrobiaceae bacterium]
MVEQAVPVRDPTASSTGQLATGAGWLDLHFEAERPEYQAIVREAGFRPGWHVLDAGCGSGGFLPLLAELVGPTGRLTALDLAPDNVAIAGARAVSLRLAAPVQADVGSVTALPYPDDAFDGLWCAAVLQYLTDDELATALAEFRRVVRPGGLIAIKDGDGTVMRFASVDLSRWWRLRAALARTGSPRERGALRGPELRGFLRRAGLTEIRLRTTLVERWAPYAPVEREFLGTLISTFARLAQSTDLPDSDRREWERLRDTGDAILDDPDHFYREGHVLAVGRVPVPDDQAAPG